MNTSSTNTSTPDDTSIQAESSIPSDTFTQNETLSTTSILFQALKAFLPTPEPQLPTNKVENTP